MSRIKVLNQIRISDIGPVNQNGRPIHLQQGSLDGACGIYSLFMALTICGAVKDKDHKALLSADPVRKNTSTGRALFQIQKLTTKDSMLFRDGVHLSQLKKIIDDAYKTSIKPEENNPNVDIKDFIIEEIDKNSNPVILHLCDASGRGGHAVVVVGTECSDVKKNFSRLFLLDPGVPTPTLAAWNSIIDLSPRSEVHKKWDVNGEQKIKLHRALAIKRKK
ncbi:MAG: hypothetical protein PHI31_12680 [Desulfuromonadaceae bacterium]|nr:hypothetical protein [Desulfuromonadaceae bacterium]